MIFDCDGVLVDSEAIVMEIESEALTAAGFSLTVDEIADRFVGLSYVDMMAVVAADFGREVPPELSGRIQADALAAFTHRLEPVRGMRRFLEQLTAARCVASSSDADRIELSLDVTGLAAFFDPTRVYSAQMVDRGKPAPDLFLHAATDLDVDPARCVVIEDSPHGVAAALAAGMRVVGFVGGRHARPSLTRRLRDAGAGVVVDHPDQLPAHL